MVNFLIQYSKRNFDFSNDMTYQELNHFDYKHFHFIFDNVRFDFLQHKQDREKRFLEDKDTIICYLGNILFNKEEYNTIQQLRLLFKEHKDITHEIKSGRFIVIRIDKNESKITIVNDRFGLIPYFIYSNKEQFILCTEPKGIILSPIVKNVKFNLDWATISNYLKCEYILGEKYFFKEIKRQKPAVLLTTEKEKVFNKIFWKPQFCFDEKINRSLLNELEITFKQGILENKKKYKGTYICDLSAGYDSRYIFFHEPDVNLVMTLGDSDCDEYSIVTETLKRKSADLINVKPRLDNESIEKTFDISDNLTSLTCTHVYDIVNHYNEMDIEVEYGYDGFLGDAIFGGTYLNQTKEFMDVIGLKPKYSEKDFHIYKFNESILDNDFSEILEENDDFKSYINTQIIQTTTQQELKKQLLEFKFYNRGINYVNGGALLTYKYYNKFFPYFYYPFFDLYTRIRLDDLRLRTVHTKLFKRLPKKYQTLSDNHFFLPFSYPHHFRILFSFFYKHVNNHINKRKKYFEPEKLFIKNDALISFYKNILFHDDYLRLFNQKILQEIFNDKQSLQRNYAYLTRCVGLLLFINKYKFKIKKDDLCL